MIAVIRNHLNKTPFSWLKSKNFNVKNRYGLSIKDILSHEGMSSADIFWTREFLQMRTSAPFWCKKTSDFSKFTVFPNGQGGGVQFFWTAPLAKSNYGHTESPNCLLA